MFVVSVILLSCSALSRAQAQGREGWAGYEEHPGLRGWLKLHAEPADWRSATTSCLEEDAQLASPWSREFTAAVNELQARHRTPLLHSGLRATLPFLSGELPASLESSALVRCGVFFANGSTAERDCQLRLPYVCYASKPGGHSRLWPGYEYRAALHGFLKIHTRPSAWRTARVNCQLEGAFLASTWNEEFTSAIQALHNTAFPGDEELGLYTGSHILISFADGVYKYANGEPQISVSPSELMRGERCGVLYGSGAEGNVDCEEPLPYVCYAPSPTAANEDPSPAPSRTNVSKTTPTNVPVTAPTTSSSPASTSDPKTSPAQTSTPSSRVCTDAGLGAGYVWSAVTAECYKFHEQGQIWTEANATCAAEGARLGIPDSTEEAALFAKMLEDRLEANTIVSKLETSVAVGIYWLDGEWMTLDGVLLEETGFKRWWPGWPFEDSIYPFAFLESSGTLENFSGTFSTPFICEADVYSK